MAADTLTDASVAQVARRCSRLTHLDVSRCPSIGDLTASAVAASCKGITFLNLAECIFVRYDCRDRWFILFADDVYLWGWDSITDET